MPPRPPELPGVRHRDVDAGGVRLHVAEAGPEDGPVAILVHGWPQHWWCWRRVLPHLTERFRCVMPDLRGHGWSEAPADGYDKEQLATDLLNLMDALRLDRAGYVGHDWGAFVGFLLALRAPERISRLLALSIPHLWPSRHDRLNPWRLAAFGYQVPLSAPLVGERLMRAGLTRTVLRAASPRGTFDRDGLDAYQAVMGTPEGARVTVAMYRTFLLREAPAIVAGRYARAHLTTPTRLVVGDRDLVVRNADLRGHESHADDLRVERIPGAGHFLPEERPELVGERAAVHLDQST
ncbi:MAG TPA: alpha/beta fold hydrolase [Thermoleophilaceae bacterium]|nr:alpha/beta fold hydrolase [Thermoleophilaceae bacterium]